MFGQSVRFTCTTLAGTEKAGVLPKDEYGYRVQPIGALNAFNSAGEYYPAAAAKELFQKSSAFMRRVASACLKSEEGHPKRVPGMTDADFIRRVLTIDERNVCAHISDVWLDFDSLKDAQGRQIIAIMGKVKPAGPYGAALEASYENPREDVCFSIRAFTEDRRYAGVNQRTLIEVVTFDRVTEPGISTSRKYAAPALESMVDAPVHAETVRRAVQMPEGVAMESNMISPQGLLKLLGLRDIRESEPGFMKW
jgi:hypothetical protein